MEFERLYKFHSMSVNSLSALATKTVWFSNQVSLNDPFEGVSNIVEPESSEETISQSVKFVSSIIEKEANISNHEAHEIALEKYLENPNDFLEVARAQAIKENEIALNYARDMGIFSTAADIPNDSKTQAANMLLWSHYSDGLRGYCIQFDAKELYDSLKKDNPESIFAWAKVDYVTKPHELDMFSFVDNGNFNYFKQLQTKHEQWGYECECRIICNDQGLKKISTSSVKALYIGEKIEESQEHLLLTIFEHNYPNADIYKVKIDDKSYGIRIGKKT